MIRFFDLIVSIVGVLLLLPFYLVISILIIVDNAFPIFYRQKRIGINGTKFNLLKFRTMRKNSEKKGLLTVGERDSRITRVGFYLRKFKLDELPQLFNVIKGEMALVGPRPEVEKYVVLYNEKQKEVLKVKPGITDLASIEYINENELLAKSADPEKTYIEVIMPHKIDINLKYIENRNLISNISVLLRTVFKIFA